MLELHVLSISSAGFSTVIDLLEDFDQQLESHLFDNADQQFIQSVVEHRRQFDVLAAETHCCRLSLYNHSYAVHAYVFISQTKQNYMYTK